MLKIRLMRMGMKGAPSYRVVVADARSPRDGRIVENIGWYNPLTEPSTITIDVGVCPTGTGAPEGDRSQGVNGFVLNTVTPETDGTCHYFWSFCRNYNLRDQALTTKLRQGVHHVFAEDEKILEAQQKAFEMNPGRTFYNLNIDGGAMWMRQLIDDAVALEKPEKTTHAV